jgi:uncharacterized protein with NRDE domain
MVFGLDPEAPLVVGANRDERLDRPARAMTVLQQGAPRILGGLDQEAGGTWLAVNEHGLVAGLTNRPVPEGRNPAKRTRGELPLALARHRRASQAVDDFVGRFSPADYNPAWFLVGDRQSLYAIDLTDGERPVATELTAGLHILENAARDAPSAKVDAIRSSLGAVDELHGAGLMEKLRSVLADHAIPSDLAMAPDSSAAEGTNQPDPEPATAGRRPETLAACVHTENYGTRSSAIIRVPAGAGPPDVLSTDGPPCQAPLIDAGALWRP